MIFFFSHLSIGIATGISFCGVVGHKERQEYTGEQIAGTNLFHNFASLVIGPKVNMSARIMSAFTDSVTCDESTYLKASLAFEFLPCPVVKLKGITNPGNTYFLITERYHFYTDNLSQQFIEIHQKSIWKKLFVVMIT